MGLSPCFIQLGRVMSISIATAEEITQLTAAFKEMSGKVDLLTREVKALQKDALPEWLTVRQAAEHLHLTEATVRKKVSAGYFDTRRNGGKNILISRDSL